jgi:hypothetical protein
MKTKYIFWGYKWWHVKLKQRQVEDARKRKEKDTVTDSTLEQASVYASEYLVHCEKAQVSWHCRMNRRSNYYMRRMIGRTKAAEGSSTGWTDCPVGSTVGISDTQFESRQRHTKKDSTTPDEPTPWLVEASVYSMVLRKLTIRFWRGVLQQQMNRCTIGWSIKWFVCTVMCSWGQRLVAPDEPTPREA